jgi:hypothetical protein
LFPVFIELVGKPVKVSGTGAALEENQRRGLAEETDAMEREEHLLVGPLEAEVLAAGRGVDLDPVDTEERLNPSIGSSMIARTRRPSAAFASSRSTIPAMTLGILSSTRSAAELTTSTGSGASRSGEYPCRATTSVTTGIDCPRSGALSAAATALASPRARAWRARRPPWCDAAGMGCDWRANAARS